MVLSNVEIQRALDERRIVLTPEPWPRRVAAKRQRCPYQTSAVDLMLGDQIAHFRENLPLDINLVRGGFATFFALNSIQQTITDEQPFVLKPGRLVLGRTHECIELPIGSEDDECLAARVEGRSSFARCGLMIHLTAPTIHAGFHGTITLELCNVGPFNIALYPLMPVCQLIVESVKGVPFRNDGQFQGQRTPAGHP